MLDYKVAEEILKNDELNFYKFLEMNHPDGFPLFPDKFPYWQEVGEKEFPEDFSILSCSKLDAFTFYAGVKFFKEKCFINNELIFPAFTTATDLRNYQALKLACMNEFMSPDLLKKHYHNQSGAKLCLHFAVQLREHYQAAGDMYLAQIYGAWSAHENKEQYTRQALEALRSAEMFGWESASKYVALRKYDPEINYYVRFAIEKLEIDLGVNQNLFGEAQKPNCL